MRQIRMGETEKAVHMTYFFSGKTEEVFPGEEREFIPTVQGQGFRLQPGDAGRPGGRRNSPENGAGRTPAHRREPGQHRRGQPRGRRGRGGQGRGNRGRPGGPPGPSGPGPGLPPGPDRGPRLGRKVVLPGRLPGHGPHRLARALYPGRSRPGGAALRRGPDRRGPPPSWACWAWSRQRP